MGAHPPTAPVRRRRISPARNILAAFLLAATAGTVLLRLPAASAHPGDTHWVDAAFTAVSALCVTGLVTVDTASQWTTVGHVTIALLIQLGGFGVMTFAMSLGLLVLRRSNLSARLSTATEKNTMGLAGMGRVIGGIVRITVLVESATASVLAARLWAHYHLTPGDALGQGVFHAVSAFNNAGFALRSDSLTAFAGDPWICLPIAGSVILGGLGFPVIFQLTRCGALTRRWSLTTRLVVVGTVILLVLGTLAIGAVEWANPATLGRLPVGDRVLAAFFQSVQTRTAGFNSVDIGQMHPVTHLVMDVLMLIGGGPAGTAGGIKITTFGVLFAVILAELRGDGTVSVLGRRLPRSVHRQAITVVLLSIAFIMTTTAALMLITPFPLDRVLFEAISAFGTVGLSTGITPDLPTAGKTILMVLMLVGRLGPITAATALAVRRRTLYYELPKERPLIG